MKTHQIRRLPVVNEKHEIVGILSLSDLARMAGIEPSLIAAVPAEHAAKQRIGRIITAA